MSQRKRATSSGCRGYLAGSGICWDGGTTESVLYGTPSGLKRVLEGRDTVGPWHSFRSGARGMPQDASREGSDGLDEGGGGTLVCGLAGMLWEGGCETLGLLLSGAV